MDWHEVRAKSMPTATIARNRFSWVLLSRAHQVLATIKRMAAVGGAVAVAGWVIVMSPAVAHAQPLYMHTGNGITCPGGGDVEEVQYVRDPDNSNAYYVCANGLPQQHRRCQPGFRLNMNSRPPMCFAGVKLFSRDGGGDKLPSSATTTPTTSFGMTPALAPPARAVGPTDGRSRASLRGCIIGLNCGPIVPKHPKPPRLVISETPPSAADRFDSRVGPSR